MTLYLVVFEIIFFVFFFFSNAVGDATSRQTNAAGSAVGHAFSRRKITRVTAHTLIYVSQCEMRHSNPVPQHRVFTAPFPVFSPLFVTHVSPVCYRSESVSLTSNFASSSPVFSISFYLPFFALHVCRLIHKLSLCFVVHVVFKIILFFSNAVGDAISYQTNAAGSAVGHAFSRRKRTNLQHKV